MAFTDKLLAVGCAGAVFLGICALYLPDPQPRPPIDRDLGIPSPMCPALPISEPTKAATCNPACKVTEVCISGTCCQPAESWRGELIATGIWAADTLR